MPFSLSTSCIKLCEIIFCEMICTDFLHIFFPDNKTRRKRNQQMPDFLNILLFNWCVNPRIQSAFQPYELKGEEGGIASLLISLATCAREMWGYLRIP